MEGEREQRRRKKKISQGICSVNVRIFQPSLKINFGWAQWLTFVIPATQEA
jgi:hypothetical protein